MELEQELFPPQKPERLSFLELCYGILVSPKATMQRVAETEPLWHGLTILISLSILNTIVNFFVVMPQTFQQVSNDLPELQQIAAVAGSPSFLLILALGGVVGGIIVWFLKAGIFQVLAELAGGKGRAMAVMVVLGCSVLPTIFTIPIQVIGASLQLNSFILGLLTFPFVVWAQLYLPVVGLKAVHGISTVRATMVVVAPVIILIGLTIMAVIVMGVFFASIASQFSGF